MVYSLPGIRLPTSPSIYKYAGSSFHDDRSNLGSSLFSRKLLFSRKILYGRTSCDSNSSSFVVAASDKVIASSDESICSSSQIEAREPQVFQNANNIKDGGEDGELKVAEKSVPFDETIRKESDITRHRTIPSPGAGTKIYEIDPVLCGYREHLDYRFGHYKIIREAIDKYEGGLEAFSRGYEKFGFNRSATGITYREWAPGAKSAALIGDFNKWNPNANIMTQDEFGVWEIFLPNNVDGSIPIPHGSQVKIRMNTQSGMKDSIPAWIKFSTQAPGEIPFNGIYYDPPEEDKHVFQHPRPKKPKSLRIYEAHVGMSSTVCIPSLPPS